MAYMNQETKAKIAPKVKKILGKYKLKGSLAVRNYTTLVLNIKSGPIDFIGNLNRDIPEDSNRRAKDCVDVNVYHIGSHYTGIAAKALTELRAALNAGNHDNSDIQTDYFDVGWYVDINVGKWNKPYILVK